MVRPLQIVEQNLGLIRLNNPCAALAALVPSMLASLTCMTMLRETPARIRARPSGTPGLVA